MTNIDGFYIETSNILKEIIEKGGTIRNICYKKSQPAKYIALLQNVLTNYRKIKSIVKETGLFIKNKYLSVILCYEMLENRVFLKEYSDLIIKIKKQNIDLISYKPKKVFVRINKLKKNTNVLEGFDVLRTDIPDVYEILNDTLLYRNEFYKKYFFYIQNVVTCIPPYILNPGKRSFVVDCCAAPGNKTTHLSMLMNNKGKIYAFEKDKQRYKILKENVLNSGANNINTKCMDFLRTDPLDYKEVTHILADPSCTGSGLHPYYQKNTERIKKLSNFQKMLLNHCFKFPSVHKIVYSTCSIHEEENEEVVKEVLEKNPDFKLKKIRRMCSGKRGNKSYNFYKKVLKFYPSLELGTIGFFVAFFKRK
ncbi:putative 28S rRNA (cytosine-C(5))-methyltransferase [Hamiltosporidium tvaerminnensis]|nr:putative 28S rRNA (cytosine-C(5))-methyltransferase [Hamiltosporidium tvaerminnensis]